jgi:histidinol-phosphate/aromatic aminotransferase/cobyric acid decarboxylase-like protein/choline kinase
MKAIILAAGIGYRMKPLTEDTHKTMLKVGDNRIIDNIVSGLILNNIKTIIVATGYLSEQLKSHLVSHYPDVKFVFVHNAEFNVTNNMYTLARVLDTVPIDDDILLIESDLIYDPGVIKKIIESPYDNVALVDKYRIGMDGTVVTINENKITNVIPPHIQDHNFNFTDKYKTLNIYKFSQSFVSETFKPLIHFYVNAIAKTSYYEVILGILVYVQKQEIYAEIIENENWAEVDDPNDLKIADFIFNKEDRYNTLASSWGGFWNYDVLDFYFIRNMYFPNSSIFSELRLHLNKLMTNYGSKQTILNEKLSFFLQCNKGNCLLLNGASQVYPFLKTLFGDKNALIPEPTFGEYRKVFPHATSYIDFIGLNDVEIFSKAKSAEIVVFVNPNNPTGSFINPAWIYEFAKARPDKTVIVDESFIDFAGSKSLQDLLQIYPLENVLIIKSLSKCLGVPGLRLGYVYSENRPFMEQLEASMPIWNNNSLAEYFLESILKHTKAMKDSFNRTIQDREQFRELLTTVGIVKEVFPSSANFILLKIAAGGNTCLDIVKELLITHGIYVKDISGKMSDGQNYFRLAVRLPAENLRFVNVLKSFR